MLYDQGHKKVLRNISYRSLPQNNKSSLQKKVNLSWKREYNQSEISRARWRMLKQRLVLSLLGQYRSQCPAFILGSNVRTKTNY